MYCIKCGSLVSDDAAVCQNCNTSLKNEDIKIGQDNVNYMDIPTYSPGHSIFLIVFSVLCCGGIIGAVFAILSLIEGDKVKGYVESGNIELAKQAKRNSNKWIKATYITWAIMAALMIVYFIFIFVVQLSVTAI